MGDDKKWSREESESQKNDDEPEEVLQAESVTLHEAETITVHEVDSIVQPKTSKKKNQWKISVDEAVNYGFGVISGVLPYLLGIVLMYITAGITFFLSMTADDDYLGNGLLIITIAFFVTGILFQLALTIGLGYKFGGDVLLRAVRTHNSVRKKK